MMMRVVGWIWDGGRTRFSRPLTADWIAVDGKGEKMLFFIRLPKKEGVDGPLMVFATTLCGRVFLTDGARRRHSEIHPLPPPPPPLPPSSPYTHLSRGGVFFFFSQSIGPFRLPTAPAAQQLSRSCYTWGPHNQKRNQPFRIMTLVGY